MSSAFPPGDYGLYFEHDFRHRWLRPHLLQEKLKKYASFESLSFESLGRSIEGRDISVIRWGRGNTKILVWSQMHGNEPTATMALVDLLNFLVADGPHNEFRSELAEKLSIVILPMLNPDGAERFTRENAVGVDLNRDAVSRQMPEMRLFHELLASFKPHWGFNLHDQRSIFSAGDSGYPATISFLSASADPSKKMTPAREKSMKLIGFLADTVEENIPRHIGRYNDEFYPRALGDFFHQQEIPCVLIESGAYPDDEFRDQARKMNFLCLTEAFRSIASGEYEQGETSGYLSIPENQTNFYDLIIRNCKIHYRGQTFSADIGLLLREQVNAARQFLEQSWIVKEIGDLKFHFGLREEEGGSVNIDDGGLKPGHPADFVVLRSEQSDISIKKGVIE